MTSSRFEYFLNAIHYCIWLIEKRNGRIIRELVDNMLFPIPKCLFSKEHKEEFNARLSRNERAAKMYFNDRRNGYHIGLANHWFGYFYSSYPGFLSFLLLGFVFRFNEDVNPYVIFLTVSVPIGILYIPAYKAVFKKDRYLYYFGRFEKKGEEWHKKWMRITMCFCILAIVVDILGICASFMIAIF